MRVWQHGWILKSTNKNLLFLYIPATICNLKEIPLTIVTKNKAWKNRSSRYAQPHGENYKTLFGDIKGDLKKWRDTW